MWTQNKSLRLWTVVEARQLWNQKAWLLIRWEHLQRAPLTLLFYDTVRLTMDRSSAGWMKIDGAQPEIIRDHPFFFFYCKRFNPCQKLVPTFLPTDSLINWSLEPLADMKQQQALLHRGLVSLHFFLTSHPHICDPVVFAWHGLQQQHSRQRISNCSLWTALRTHLTTVKKEKEKGA